MAASTQLASLSLAQTDFKTVAKEFVDTKWQEFVRSKFNNGRFDDGFGYLGTFVKKDKFNKIVVDDNDNKPTIVEWPIPLEKDEVYGTQTWTDYVRVNLGYSAVQGQKAKPLLMLQFPVGNGVEKYTLMPTVSASSESYDLTQQPVPRTFNKSMRDRHWSEINREFRSWEPFSHVSVAAGFYLNEFAVPGDNANLTHSDVSGYFLGVASTVQPYFTLHLGLAAYDGKRSLKAVPAVGFTVDLAVLGRFFGSGK